MHSQIDVSRQKCLLELFQEQSFTAFCHQRHIQCAIPLGGDADDFNLQIGMNLAQCVTHMIGLPHGQLAAAGTNSDRCHRLFVT